MTEASLTPEYKCLLCLKPYNQPRELPCNHTFCCSCLTSYIDKEYRTEYGDRQYFPCPACDSPISLRNVNFDVDTLENLFPINNLFITPKGKTSTFKNCDACRRAGESNPAVVWCTGCTEMLCKACRTFHDRIKITAKHRLVTSSEVGFRDTTVNGNCLAHEERELELYCLDHRSMCCCICVSVSHKSCDNIKPIDDVIKKSFTEQRSHETPWKNIKDEAAKMLEADESAIISLNTDEKELSVEVLQMIQQAKVKLDCLNEAFQSELARKCIALRKQLSDRMISVKKFRTNAENSNMLMTRIDKQGTNRQRFLIREKTKYQMSGHYRRMNLNSKAQPNMFDLKLDIGNCIDNLMKMTSIGNVAVISGISLPSQTANTRIGTLLEALMLTPATSTFADSFSASDIAGLPTAGPVPVDVWSGSVSCALSVDGLSLAGRSTPVLAGGIFTESGDLLATDFSNGRLLLFDENYRYRGEYKVDRMPSAITHGLHTDEILVSAETGFMRCTLRNGQLNVIETIRCRGVVYGIAVLGDNILVCTNRSVEIMSPDGIIRKSIQRSPGYTHLVASTSTSQFYYIDGNDVVCRRLDSDVEEFRYSDPGLRSPAGIGLDRGNNIYVCGRDSSNVYIISPDGSHGKVLVTGPSSFRSPLGVIVHPTKDEFAVTSFRHATTLEVYRFGNNTEDSL